MAAPSLEGNIAAPPAVASATGNEAEFATLNEPVSRTIMRDLNQVSAKLKMVLSPYVAPEDSRRELRNWDLWGPLLLCLTLSLLLSITAPDDQKSLVFSSVFAIVWVGSAVVTANAQLLGGKISFFQSVCVLGYCVCPLVLAAIACLASRSGLWRAPVVTGSLVWACRASLLFFGDTVPGPRRVLAAFPVALFYILLAWMVFVA